MTNETHPQLKIVRNAKNKKARHFGPFPDATAARETFKLLNRLYPLRKCNTYQKRPCLYFHINECLGYCCKEVDKSTIDEMKKEIISEISKMKNKTSDEIAEERYQKFRKMGEFIRL